MKHACPALFWPTHLLRELASVQRNWPSWWYGKESACNADVEMQALSLGREDPL